MTVKLSPREQQIVDLLLTGADNAVIAKELDMAVRTVKSHFNRMYMRFGIHDGVKRVKLATMIYRKQLKAERKKQNEKVKADLRSSAVRECNSGAGAGGAGAGETSSGTDMQSSSGHSQI
jgi:FixJ family two-component response regulator